MNKHRQQGFALLEALVILLVLVLISGTALYFWQARQSSSSSDEKTVNVESILEETGSLVAPDCSKGYTASTSGDKSFALCLPNGWEVERYAEGYLIMGSKQPVADTDKKLIVTDLLGSDGESVFHAALLPNEQWQYEPKGTKSETQIEAIGSVTKYLYVDTEKDVTDCKENQGDICPTVGTKRYTYVMNIGDDRQFQISYKVYPSDPVDNYKLVEQIVSSLRVRK